MNAKMKAEIALRRWAEIIEDDERLAKLEDWMWEEGMDVTPSRVYIEFTVNTFDRKCYGCWMIFPYKTDFAFMTSSYMDALERSIYQGLRFLVDQNT